MRVICEVKQEDIDKDCHGGKMCPVALALKRAGVFDEVLYVEPKPKWAPSVVHTFIRRYDAGLRVEPFSFPYKTKGQLSDDGVTR